MALWLMVVVAVIVPALVVMVFTPAWDVVSDTIADLADDFDRALG